ncbi:ImmA/IrrE family metallo-endopeptidase, partial [Caloramator proteoclasticus]
MAGNRSFKDYVAERFYNEIFATIQNYVIENKDTIDLWLYRVRNIGEIELSDIEVKFVSVSDLPEMKIEFDIVVEAELEVRESDYHYDESENCRQWFQLKCSGDLKCNLDDFIIYSVTDYTSKNKQPKPMSDSLVPFIYSEQLESVATEFLRKNYPEALKTPMAVDPQLLAEKMGLKIEIRDITKDFTVFGQIFFHDCEAEFYDKNSDKMVQTHVIAKTIFVDPKVYFLRNLGSVNNTIVHECVHWALHRKAFELERLYNNSVTKIKCQVVGGIKDSNRDATDWMEWQANALTPRIQMPISTFKEKAFELIKKYKQSLQTEEIIDVMEPVIDELALFFGVSRLAAKIRMIDVGYEEAIGTFTYIDGHYVKPHCFKKGFLKRNQTFSISAIDAAIQSFIDPELSALIKEGSYVYVDSHFVLKHPKYVTRDENGYAILTDYARTHMEECCLVFDLSIKSGFKESYHSECFLNRDKGSNIDF